jgi:hypothetical protein
MFEESVVHTLIGVVVGALGWILKVQWDAVRSLDEEVDTLKVLVASDYAKREELREEFKRLFDKLDTIEAKLDKKADK